MYRGQACQAFMLAGVAGLSGSLMATPSTEVAAPNIVLVVLDDVGLGRLAFYGEGTTPATTPQLSALAAGGVVFSNAWGSAACTPARAMINTGLYGIHSGIGSNRSVGLPLNANILPERLAANYTSAAIGKWHLGNNNLGPSHPNDSGYALYSGALKNFEAKFSNEDYFNWRHTVNGGTSWDSVYAPTVNINDSIQAVNRLQEPFFLYLNFNSIHKPLHEPPPNLHTQTNLPLDPNDDPIAYVNAMTEAMDTELGRLLAVLPANTYVIVVGDNGPFDVAAEPPLDSFRVKGTMYQGGLRVPLLISGPRVIPGQTDALVSTVDLFS
ncbi:MAG: sulfatase-like hydrolase/transferase, partial [Planctomycetota bacterium]|nr:sulfatase-like hydrolase/transferase [Planctomycetota bacterium]